MAERLLLRAGAVPLGPDLAAQVEGGDAGQAGRAGRVVAGGGHAGSVQSAAICSAPLDRR